MSDAIPTAKDTYPFVHVIEERKSLAERKLDVARTITNIKKDGTNTAQGNFDYVTAESLIEVFRGPLHDEGLDLRVSTLGVDHQEQKNSIRTTVELEFVITCAETGECLATNWFGVGTDPGDKSIYKAYTGAIKTWIRSNFLIPYGDDPEASPTGLEPSTKEKTAAQNKPLTKPQKEKLKTALMGVDDKNRSLLLASIGLADITDLDGKVFLDQASRVYELMVNKSLIKAPEKSNSGR